MINDVNRKWWILGAIGGALGLVVLDETILGVALPTIQKDLGLSQVDAHWIISAYLLSLTGLAAAAGRVSDFVSIRNVFLAGVLVFGFSSLACGFAENGAWLITARVVQGIGAAMILPTTVAMLTKVFPFEQRGQALGIYTACGAIFMALGPFAGGFLIDVLSWRWIFWINLPVVALITLIMWRGWVTVPHTSAAPRFDTLGLATLVLGLSAFVLGLMQGSEWGWSAPATLGALAGGAFLLVAFVVIETRTAAPLIETRLFQNPTFASANLTIFTGQFCKFSVIVFVAVYLQKVLGMSPLYAGIAMLPAVLPLFFSAVIAGWLTDRYGVRRPMLYALFFHGVSLLGMAWAVWEKSYSLLVAPMILWSLVVPLLYVPSRHVTMAVVPEAEQGEAGGISLTAQLLGGTIGMAISGAVLAVAGNYRTIFLVSGALSMAVLVIAWFTLDRQGKTQ